MPERNPDSERCKHCGQEVTAMCDEAIKRRAAVDAKYINMIHDATHWYSRGQLSYLGMTASVSNAMHFWRVDREAIGS